MPDSLTLLPAPRHLTLSGRTYALPARALLVLDDPHPQALFFAARRLQHALPPGVNWEITASRAAPREHVALTLRLAPDRAPRPQGYELTIAPDGILIEGHDPAGAFYSICTLIQLIQLQASNLRLPTREADLQPPTSSLQLPTLHLSDWPDFPARGVMLDISRDKVPTLETLYGLVDMLAGWKINQLQLYTEHTFAYRQHPEVWAEASPLTGQEILGLDAYCRERFVELAPNQNSFGHKHRWLKHPRYAPLAEVTDIEVGHGWGRGPFSLCPLDPGSLALVTSLYDELLPHFSSRMVNVGCDETFDLGAGRSRAECERRGKGRVYLDFLLKIYEAVTARGRTMQFWGDIVMEHPELVAELPQDVIALEWGYEAGHPFDGHGAMFASAGLQFYVCPGTSSWNSIAGRTANALGNLLNAAENGLKHGASGYLITDWGDNGHWQVLPVSYVGFAVGAAYAWALEANRALDAAQAVSQHAFRDPTGALGRVAYDLGNVYRAVGVEPHNSSALFWAMLWQLEQVRGHQEFASPEALQHTLEAIGEAMRPLPNARSLRADAELIRREFEHTASLLRHACQRALLAHAPSPGNAAQLSQDLRAIIGDYQGLWLARNRPGGLNDSLARLEHALTDYTVLH